LKTIRLFIFTTLIVLLASCSPAATSSPTPGPVTLTVMTHDSFAVSEEVVQEFEDQNNAKLVFIKSGDTGAALNRAILTKNAPEADIFYGVDNTFLSRAIQEEIFEPYTSSALSGVTAEFTGNLGGQVTPIDFGDVCINYDSAWFAAQGLPVPQSLADLTDPQYGGEEGRGLLVVENPATY